MAEENMTKAKEVYNTLLAMLNNKGWTNYDKDEEKLLIHSGVKGEDLPIEFILVVNPKNEIITFYSALPFEMAEDKRIDAAVAVCVANYGMADGSFDYDISSGRITFRMTSSYTGSKIGEDLFEYMIMVASMTVDKYNDKFLMLSKGLITLEQFMASDK